jgi:hypothetical protein
MQPISPVTFQWRGVTLGTAPYEISPGGVDGWLGLPDVSRATIRAAGHGSTPSPGSATIRRVTLRGWVRATRDNRDALLAQLQAAFILPASRTAATEPLVGTIGGVTATVNAQLDAFDPDTNTWSSPFIRWAAEWVCPDPRKFADPVSASAPLVASSPGDVLPFVLPVTLSAQPIGGRVSIWNPGTDPEGSNVTVTLTGEQSGDVGVRSVTTGAQVVYDLALAVDDRLVVDSESGAALNGEYRPARAYSSPARRLRAVPGLNVYEALGAPGSGSPAISVSVIPASW